jgi:hypothetical protein
MRLKCLWRVERRGLLAFFHFDFHVNEICDRTTARRDLNHCGGDRDDVTHLNAWMQPESFSVVFVVAPVRIEANNVTVLPCEFVYCEANMCDRPGSYLVR